MRAFLWAVILVLAMAVPAQGRTLRIAVEDAPPYSVWTGSVPEGAYASIATRFATALGLSPVFVRSDRGKGVKMLESGEVDCMVGLKRRPDREDSIWFPDQPVRMHSTTAFWTKKGSGILLKRQSDLYGRAVGVLKGERLSPVFDGDSRIERFPQTSRTKLFKLLVAGKVSVVAMEIERGQAALSGTGFSKWVEMAPYSLSGIDPEFLAVSRKSRLATEPEYVEQALAKVLSE